jgi:hypothetical protein
MWHTFVWRMQESIPVLAIQLENELTIIVIQVVTRDRNDVGVDI